MSTALALRDKRTGDPVRIARLKVQLTGEPLADDLCDMAERPAEIDIPETVALYCDQIKTGLSELFPNAQITVTAEPDRDLASIEITTAPSMAVVDHDIIQLVDEVIWTVADKCAYEVYPGDKD